MGIYYLSKPKQPAEKLPRYVDFVDRVASGDTIAGCTITAVDEVGTDVTASLVDGPTSLSGTKVYYTILGYGTDGKQYKITFRATSTAGAIVEEDLVLEVRQL